MKGLGIPQMPNRSTTAWRVYLAALLISVAGVPVAMGQETSAKETAVVEPSAKAEPSATAAQSGADVLSEAVSSTDTEIAKSRTKEVEHALAVGAEAAKLARDGNYSEAGVSYAKSLAMLEVVPGSYASGERSRLQEEYAKMKAVWYSKVMANARKQFEKGDYADAIRTASDALFIDESKVDSVNDFITFCQARIKADAFDKATAANAEGCDPTLLSDEEQIDLLFREADVYERAYRYADAQKKLEAVFLIDPLNSEANTRLRALFNKLYGAGSLQSQGVILGISANASWTYVRQVAQGRSIPIQNRDSSEHSPESDLYRLLEKVLVTAEYTDESIFEVIDEQNRNLLRAAPERHIMIVPQFSHQTGEKLSKITITAVNMPLIDLLRYVCMQTDLKMKIEDNTIVLGPPWMDDLSTRRFPISAEIIQDIAEISNPYYHLNNVLLASDDSGSGGGSGSLGNSGGPGGAAGDMGAAGMSGMATGGATGGMAGMAMGMAANMPMGAAGMTTGAGYGNDTGRIPQVDYDNTGTSSGSSSGSGGDDDYTSGVSQGIQSLGLTMDALGIDTEDSDSENEDMGSVGAPTPPVTSVAMKSYFSARGISFPGDSTISYNRRKGEILMTNTVENLRKMEDLLKQLDELRPPMVQVEIKMVELSESDIKELGFDWYFNANTSDTATDNWKIAGNEQPLRHYSSTDPNSINSGDENYRIINNLKIFPNFGESLFGANSDINLSLTVNAMNLNQRAEVLTAPKLLLSSGDIAVLKVVDNMTFPESWDDPDIDITDDTVQITYPVPDFDDGNDIGVVLACRAIVDPDNYTISLYLYPQVTAYVGHADSEYDVKMEAGTLTTNSSGQTVSKNPSTTITATIWMPEITVREMEMNVQVYDGATVVLGGMTEQYNTQRNDKWPVLGDIPLVGRLFSSQMTQHEKRTLLAFVTARLMNADGTPWRSNEPFGVPDFVW